MLSTPRREIRCISSDPGTVHYAVCHLAFYGFDYKKDEKDGSWLKIPNFKILNWELWDLKRKITYGYNEERHCMLRNRYGSPSEGRPVEGIMNLAENITEFVGTKEWMTESYISSFYENGQNQVFPAIVTELQCGQIKNHEWDVFLMSHLFPWAIKTVHHTRSETREVISRARKYGMANDGSLSYDERKAKAEEITRALLKITGMSKWITFLNAVKAARKLDVPGKTPQAHDLADSFLLGLQYCIQEYEEQEKSLPKSQMTEVPVVSKNIEITICDDSDEEQDKKKKPTKLPIETDNRKMISMITLSDNLTAAFEKMDKKPKATKRKREFIDDDDLSEEAEMPVKKSRKKPPKLENVKEVMAILKPKPTTKPRKKAEPKEKKIPAAKKYKQLAFVTQ